MKTWLKTLKIFTTILNILIYFIFVELINLFHFIDNIIRLK